jgi:hypothetical protein
MMNSFGCPSDPVWVYIRSFCDEHMVQIREGSVNESGESIAVIEGKSVSSASHIERSDDVIVLSSSFFLPTL